MESYKQLSAEINFEMVKSLANCSRKLSNRIELRISQNLFERLQNRFSLSGQFREYTELEKYLKLIKKNAYEDGYKAEIELLVFRVQKPKFFKGLPKDLKGQAYTSCPKLIAKYIRTGHMPEIEL